MSTDPTSTSSTHKLKRRVESDPVAFSVSARVAMQLGRESISSSITAILELVKNAYDADADWVRIRFATRRWCRVLLIEDNGDGMTPDALRQKWMVIGTSNKVTDRTSGRSRVKTGEKGLGRLGLDRLCRHTRVQSKTSEASEAFELRINWAKYETPDTRLETVKHAVYLLPNLNTDPVTHNEVEFTKGTRLVLSGLKDRWDEEQLKELHQELSFLVSPFGEAQDFSIEIDTDGIAPSIDGAIQAPDEMLDQAYWKVASVIDKDGQVSISMSSSQRTLSYQQPPTPWSELVKGYGDVPQCGPLSFDFYFYDRDEIEGNEHISRTSIINFLKSNQGIRIYRDGFRVKPYGDPDGAGDCEMRPVLRAVRLVRISLS